MDQEQLEILKDIYFATGKNPREQVKEKYGIENLKKVERQYIKNLIIHYEELQQVYEELKVERENMSWN